MLRILIMIGLFWMLPGIIYAQKHVTDTIISLREVTISGTRSENFAIGSMIAKFDSLTMSRYLLQSLGDILTMETGLSIQSYGPGGLTQLSMRGGGTAHTPLIYNGFNLQSPMNGGVNLADFPLFLVDKVAVQYGGSGTLYGSGAVSGLVQINTADLFKEKNSLLAGGGFGSFNNKTILAKVKAGNKNIASAVRIIRQDMENDFRYRNITKFGTPFERQSNAAFSQLGILQENQIRISSKSLLSVNAWFQHQHKELQTLMTDNQPSAASQADENLYLTANYNHITQSGYLQVKSGLFYNKVLYTDINQPSENGNNASTSIISEVEDKFIINRLNTLLAGVNLTSESARSLSYTGRVNRNRISFFSSYRRLVFSHLTLVANARSEEVDGQFLPLVYSFSGNLALKKEFIIKSTFSKNYRVPSLNDLYWLSGIYTSGNPNLKPEYGWNSELGIQKNWKFQKAGYVLSGTVYYTKTNDWILWLPAPSGKWIPENEQTGQSYGVETFLKQVYTFGKKILRVSTSYNYTHASLDNNNGGEQSKLLYIPKNTFSTSLTFMNADYSITYSHKFCDRRYYDNSHTVNAYNMGDISAGYNLKLKHFDLTTSFKISNVWNSQYQVVAWYAMPGTNYQLMFNAKF